MKKHLPFICVFYLCLVLCALLYFVYTDSGKTIERANARIENELSDAYNKGWANGYAFSAKEYEEAAASVQPLEVSEIPGYSSFTSMCQRKSRPKERLFFFPVFSCLSVFPLSSVIAPYF